VAIWLLLFLSEAAEKEEEAAEEEWNETKETKETQQALLGTLVVTVPDSGAANNAGSCEGVASCTVMGLVANTAEMLAAFLHSPGLLSERASELSVPGGCAYAFQSGCVFAASVEGTIA